MAHFYEGILVMFIVLLLLKNKLSDEHDHMSGGGNLLPKLMTISCFRRLSRF